MSRFLRNIMLLLLAATFIVSTSGINIYLHYCSCEDQLITSAIPSSSCCDHEADTNECCSTETTTMSCCGENGNTCTSLHVTGSECCTTQHLFFRLSTDLDIQIKQEPVKLYAAFHVLFPDKQDAPSVISPPSASPDESHSIPLHGKTLLTFIHQLRLEAPTA